MRGRTESRGKRQHRKRNRSERGQGTGEGRGIDKTLSVPHVYELHEYVMWLARLLAQDVEQKTGLCIISDGDNVQNRGDGGVRNPPLQSLPDYTDS